MSGSREELPPAAETAEPEPSTPVAAGGDAPSEEGAELSAAEALARVTAEAEEVARETGAAEPGTETPTEPEETAATTPPEPGEEATTTTAPTRGEEATTTTAPAPGEAAAVTAAPAPEEGGAAGAEQPAADAGAPEPAVSTAEVSSAASEAPEAAPPAAAPPGAAARGEAGTDDEPTGAEPEAAATSETDVADGSASAEPAGATAEAAAVEPAEPDVEPSAKTSPEASGAADGRARKPARARKSRKAAKAVAPPPDRPELRVVYEALANRQSLEGRVIGWNNGGFHLALGDLAAFCPRSEMEIGDVQDPESYLDRTFEFRVLRLQGKGRRIVVSRAAHLRHERSRQRSELRKKLRPGAVLDGTVVSLKDFGAFVDLGGAQGLVHVSEVSHRRIEHPSQVLSEGQQVRVKVIKVEQGGRRISLSLRALEADPWKDLAARFPRGAVVKGTVEKANQIGAFIELAPGLTGLLPAKSMSIPRETSPARAYPPGKEVSVQIVAVDPRRQRISLALEGSGLEGSRNDYKEYQRRRREAGERDGFNALASAFRRLQDGE